MTVSTFCTCWVLHRTDGVRQGFTDHDAPIEIEGVACEAVAALDATEARSALGLGADAQDVAGALSSAAIREEDIAAGRLDDASVEVWRVDWRDPSRRTLERRATLGEITRTDGAFSAELRGLAHRLDRTETRRFTRLCDALLGDRRCGVDLAPLTVAGTVEAPVRLVARFRRRGRTPRRLVRPRRRHVPRRRQRRASRSRSRRTRARGSPCGARPPFPVAPGTGVRLVAGCDKRFATCRAKFGNAANFRGFPHMPGGDFTLGYATGGTVHDGKAIVE